MIGLIIPYTLRKDVFSCSKRYLHIGTNISVIGLAYNEATVLADCLCSIHFQQPLRPFELIMIGNAPTDAAAIAVTAGGLLVTPELTKSA